MHSRYVTLLALAALAGCAATEPQPAQLAASGSGVTGGASSSSDTSSSSAASLSASSTANLAASGDVQVVDANELSQRTVCRREMRTGSRISNGMRCYTPDSSGPEDAIRQALVDAQVQELRREQERMAQQEMEREMRRRQGIMQQSVR